MAVITRPNGQTRLDNTQLSLGTSASIAQGINSIGRTVSAAGQVLQNTNQLSMAKQLSSMIDRQGKEMFAESKAAHQTALFNDKIGEAQVKFLEAKQKRYSQLVDKNGNPTFEDLPKDIENLGKEIQEDLVGNLIDPEVKRMFSEKFTGYISNQKISGLKEAARQQERYAREQLHKVTRTVVANATVDEFEQVGTYEKEGLEALENALKAGVISKEDFQSQSTQLSAEIREGAIRNGVEKGDPGATQSLVLPASTLGISEEARNNLIEVSQAKQLSDEIQLVNAEQRNTVDTKMSIAELSAGLDERVKTLNITPQELLKYRNTLPKKRFDKLKRDLVKAQEKNAKEMNRLNNLALQAMRGETFIGNPPKDINDLYSYSLKKRSDITGKPPTLAEKAQTAHIIDAPVPAFAKELDQSVRFGNTENAEDIIAAYTYSKERGGESLESGFKASSTAIMEHTELLVERAGMKPVEALSMSRETVNDKKDSTIKFRAKQFYGTDQFKPENITRTLQEEFDIEGTFGFGRVKVSADSTGTYGQLLKQGFMMTGEEDSAKAYAKGLMSRKHGVSKVTAEPTYMFMPPEKVFPDIDPEDLKATLKAEIDGALTQLVDEGELESIDRDSYSLRSDDSTAGNIQIIGYDSEGRKITKEVNTWMVTYKKKVGDEVIEVPLRDPQTGLAVRWSPAGSNYLAERQRKRLEDLQIQKAEVIEKARKESEELRLRSKAERSPGTARFGNFTNIPGSKDETNTSIFTKLKNFFGG